MKICVPAIEDKGLEGMPHAHFGSATHFVVHDTDTGATDIVRNADNAHEHGMCHPLAAIDGLGIEAIVVGDIGLRALSKLQAGGMRVYRSAPRSIGENIELLKAGKLEEMTPADACGHHGEGHGCGR